MGRVSISIQKKKSQRSTPYGNKNSLAMGMIIKGNYTTLVGQVDKRWTFPIKLETRASPLGQP